MEAQDKLLANKLCALASLQFNQPIFKLANPLIYSSPFFFIR